MTTAHGRCRSSGVDPARRGIITVDRESHRGTATGPGTAAAAEEQKKLGKQVAHPEAAVRKRTENRGQSRRAAPSLPLLWGLWHALDQLRLGASEVSMETSRNSSAGRGQRARGGASTTGQSLPDILAPGTSAVGSRCWAPAVPPEESVPTTQAPRARPRPAWPRLRGRCGPFPGPRRPEPAHSQC